MAIKDKKDKKDKKARAAFKSISCLATHLSEGIADPATRYKLLAITSPLQARFEGASTRDTGIKKRPALP